MFNLPPATKAVAGLLILVYLLELVPQLADPLLGSLYFDPAAGPLGWIAGAATYGLLHGNAMHLVGNLLGVVILAPLAERRHGPATLLLLMLAGSFGGAVAHSLAQVAAGGDDGLIGASAAVAALIGWSLRQIRDRNGFGQVDRAVTLYGVFFIIFNLLGLVAFSSGPIAYAAHAGGFAVGWFFPAGRRAWSRR